MEVPNKLSVCLSVCMSVCLSSSDRQCVARAVLRSAHLFIYNVPGHKAAAACEQPLRRRVLKRRGRDEQRRGPARLSAQHPH